MELHEGNIFKHSLTEKKEIFNTLFSGNNIKIEQIISSGQTSPADGWFDQKEIEWVILLEGAATLEFENNSIKHLHKGDYLYIPAHCRHKVIYTSAEPNCIWLAVFFNDK
ncbi:MAG: cupin domain-containing protein [Bacteroidales bacterium]|jgi:cupin 2 domain-containing protein|nr:cupin domain-containing protein [Bacteroidales bacterium]MDD4213608.1 cupin domain-containing protein [Bacteroidales bacterium]